MRFIIGTLVVFSFFVSLVKGDVVTMTSGNEVECVVLQENPSTVSVRRGYGTMLLPRSAIASITRTPVISDAAAPTSAPAAGQHIPAWTNVLTSITRQSWASGMQPIPATVVDTGAMKHVPYQSYRCGTDYELNIYGDPDHPACVEIGMYRSLLNSSEAKQHCIDLMASILLDKTDAAIVKAMDRAQDLVLRKGTTLEITPPTATDAYGGWWVSIYDEKMLDEARATDEELKQIAVANPSAPPKPSIATTAKPAAPVRTPVTPTPVAGHPYDVDDTSWKPADMALARVVSSDAQASGSGGSGQVYVNGYYRKNGTYVHSYTRSSGKR